MAVAGCTKVALCQSDKAMRILFLCDKKYWDHKMSRVRFHAMQAIARNPAVTAAKDGPNFDGFRNAAASVRKHTPDFVFWYKPLDIPGYEGVNVPKVISYNEMWDVEWTTKEITRSRSDIVICHHENDLPNYEHLRGNHLLAHIAHCAERSVFRDYGLKKEYTVLHVGAASRDVYPLRSRFLNAIKKIPGSKVLSHPGYNIKKVDQQVVHYAREISRAKIVVTCSSRYRYALARYSEVPLCRTLLMADIPNERQIFFKEFVADVRADASEDKIIKIIRHWLADDELRKKKTGLGYQLTSANYTQEHYAERVVKLLSGYG